MKKAIVVGDLHGKFEIVERALEYKDHKIIFVGDYLDDFTRTRAEQITTAQLVINAMKEEPNRIYALKGNHELSYEDPIMRCSGYSEKTHGKVMQNLDLSELYDYLWVGDYLISHAGVSNKLLEADNISLERYLEVGNFNQIGYSRGGNSPYGGLFWCDWWEEFEPVDDTPQIVGHSQYRPWGEPEGIVTKGNSYNIDCLGRVSEVLVLEKDKEPRVMII